MSNPLKAEPSTNAPIERRKFLMLEVFALSGMFVATIVSPLLGPGLLNVFVSRYSGLQVYGAIVDLSRLGLFLFVMYASGDPLSFFGIRKIDWISNVEAFTIALVGASATWAVLFQMHAAETSKALEELRKFNPYDLGLPNTPLWLLAIGPICSGVLYEVAFRGYLIPRLEEIFGSEWIAVICQALFFGLIFSRSGPNAMIANAVMGLIFGAVFVKWRTVWPLAAAHAITSFAVVYWPIYTMSHLQ